METNNNTAERVYRLSRNENRAYEELLDQAFCKNGLGHDSRGGTCKEGE